MSLLSLSLFWKRGWELLGPSPFSQLNKLSGLPLLLLLTPDCYSETEAEDPDDETGSRSNSVSREPSGDRQIMRLRLTVPLLPPCHSPTLHTCGVISLETLALLLVPLREAPGTLWALQQVWHWIWGLRGRVGTNWAHAQPALCYLPPDSSEGALEGMVRGLKQGGVSLLGQQQPLTHEQWRSSFMRRNRDPQLNERAHRVRALQSTLKVIGGGTGHSLGLATFSTRCEAHTLALGSAHSG